ncbi:unnamed protein product [Gongylonema pulchrum]|uniref:Protein-tyrosine-phosphatase n=1 Tax=Gongylonema pulchrum TaxID=637853 RepID=A0A183EN71_9BILA|nr:unnamed protein product [Gongylonema pulchrum]
MHHVRYTVNPEYARMSELVPGLFISGVSDLNVENMQKHGITLIINATNELLEFPFAKKVFQQYSICLISLDERQQKFKRVFMQLVLCYSIHIRFVALLAYDTL